MSDPTSVTPPAARNPYVVETVPDTAPAPVNPGPSMPVAPPPIPSMPLPTPTVPPIEVVQPQIVSPPIAPSVPTSVPPVASVGIPKVGSLRASLAEKIGNTQTPVASSQPTVPDTTTTPPAPQQFVSPDLEKFPTWLGSEKGKPVGDQPSGPTLGQWVDKTVKPAVESVKQASVSAPAALTALVMVSALAFFAGRSVFTPDRKATAAQIPDATLTPMATPGQVVTDTPADIMTKSQDLFQKAVDLTKKSDQSQEEKDQISKLLTQALEILSKGIQSYPDLASLYFERAQIEKMVMQSSPTLKEQAKQDYEKALQLSPLTASYVAGYADYYMNLESPQLAIEQYQKAVQLEPTNTQALLGLAQAQEAAKLIDEALVTYDQLFKLIPTTSKDHALIQEHINQLKPTPAPVSSTPATASAAIARPTP